MTPFLKLDCISTGNTQEIHGVVCSASINEDINDSKVSLTLTTLDTAML